MTLTESIVNWLSSASQRIDVIFLTTDENLLGGMIDAILENEKVDNIVLSSQLNDSDYFRDGNERIIKLSTYKANQKPMYCFLDFADSTNIMSQYLYSDKIEWQQLFRRNCISIMTYKYTGKDMTSGYWNMTSKDVSVQTQILSISKWGSITQQLPRYTGPNIGGLNVHNKALAEAWVESMRDFIGTFVRLLFDGKPGFDIDALVDHYLSKESMEIIVRGFTHATQNAVYNYESIEHHGDNLFRSHFSEFTHNRFERITQQEATQFQLQYLSSEYQSVWSDDLSLFNRMIKHDFLGDTKKAKTDIIESFLGVMSQVARRFMLGFNHVVVETIVSTICMSLPFEKNMIFGKSKQRVIQINERLGFTANSIRIMSTKSKTADRIELSVVVEKSLNEFYNKREQDQSRSAPTSLKREGLQTIATIIVNYNPRELSEDAADNLIWKKIADCYELNNLSLQTSKDHDYIFDIIERYAPDIYGQFLAKLSSQYGLTETDLGKIKFSSNFYDNYVIMYFLPVANGEGFLTSQSMSRVGATDFALSDYEIPFLGTIQNENLAVIPYMKKADPIGTFKEPTPDQYGKYRAIIQYISM